MRRPAVPAAICAALVLLLASAAPTARATSPARAVVQVRVDIRCIGDGVQFSISPWTVRVAEGDEVDWVLTDSSQVADFAIAPKAPDWPFAAANRGRRGAPARARGMRRGLRGRRFAYAITAACARADGSTDNIVIDPDLIIRL